MMVKKMILRIDEDFMKEIEIIRRHILDVTGEMVGKSEAVRRVVATVAEEIQKGSNDDE